MPGQPPRPRWPGRPRGSWRPGRAGPASRPAACKPSPPRRASVALVQIPAEGGRGSARPPHVRCRSRRLGGAEGFGSLQLLLAARPQLQGRPGPLCDCGPGFGGRRRGFARLDSSLPLSRPAGRSKLLPYGACRCRRRWHYGRHGGHGAAAAGDLTGRAAGKPAGRLAGKPGHALGPRGAEGEGERDKACGERDWHCDACPELAWGKRCSGRAGGPLGARCQVFGHRLWLHRPNCTDHQAQVVEFSTAARAAGEMAFHLGPRPPLQAPVGLFGESLPQLSACSWVTTHDAPTVWTGSPAQEFQVSGQQVFQGQARPAQA